MPHSFQPIGSVLQAVVQQHGLTARLFEHQLIHRWTDIAGSGIAAHTLPAQIRFRKLYLLVRNSVWLQQLMFLKPTLIEKVNAAAGSTVVTDIVLRIGELDPPAATPIAPRSQSEQAPPSLQPNTRKPLVHSPLQTLQDSGLRDRLADLIASAPSSVPDASPIMVSDLAIVP